MQISKAGVVASWASMRGTKWSYCMSEVQAANLGVRSTRCSLAAPAMPDQHSIIPFLIWLSSDAIAEIYATFACRALLYRQLPAIESTRRKLPYPITS